MFGATKLHFAQCCDEQPSGCERPQRERPDPVFEGRLDDHAGESSGRSTAVSSRIVSRALTDLLPYLKHTLFHKYSNVSTPETNTQSVSTSRLEVLTDWTSFSLCSSISFQMVTRGKNLVDRAYRYLRLSPKERVVFMDNLVAAFSLLESTGGTPTEDGNVA